MSVDWITIVAQIINFLVLVWLLQRFLYGPITLAMDEREQNIRRRLDEATEATKHAEDVAARLEEDRRELEARRAEMTSAMRSEVELQRRELEERMREEMDDRREAWGREIDEEREAFVLELKRHASDHFFSLAREALSGLASKSLNDAIAECFGDRLPELDEERLQKLREAAKHGEKSAIIESSFIISPSVKRRLTGIVHELIAPSLDVDYVTDERQICGVRLRIGGQTVAWGLDSYLDRLERRARDVISQRGRNTKTEVMQ